MPPSTVAPAVVLCLLNTALLAELWRQQSLPDVLLVLLPGVAASAAMWWRRQYPVAVTAFAGATYLLSQVLLPVGFGLFTIAWAAATGCWCSRPSRSRCVCCFRA